MHYPLAEFIHIHALINPFIRGQAEEYSGDRSPLLSLTKLALIVQQSNLFDYVVHYQVRVDLRSFLLMSLMKGTNLYDLFDLKSFCRVGLEYRVDEEFQLWAVSIGDRIVLACFDRLEELVQTHFFIFLLEWTLQRT